jgi:hypothetical protein
VVSQHGRPFIGEQSAPRLRAVAAGQQTAEMSEREAGAVSPIHPTGPFSVPLRPAGASPSMPLWAVQSAVRVVSVPLSHHGDKWGVCVVGRAAVSIVNLTFAVGACLRAGAGGDAAPSPCAPRRDFI